MKDPDSDDDRAPDGAPAAPGDGNETIEISVRDVVLAAGPAEPPPVPPQPAYPASYSAAPPPPPPRRAGLLQAVLVVVVIGVALGAGAAVTLYLRRTRPAEGAGGSVTSKVITIPTVDMDDTPDAGP